MRENIHRSLMKKSWVALSVAGLITISLLLGMGEGAVQADQSLPTTTVGFQSGKITAVYQATFQIDGRTYSLTPDAVILDDSGNQLDAGYIGIEIEAKFHVKKDQSDKIDKMILILPR